MLKSLLSRWPLIEQIRSGVDGTGAESMTQRTRELRPKNDGRGSGAFDLSLLRGGLRTARLSQDTEADFD